MGDLYDKPAITAIRLANQAALDWGHEFIRPEHVLLGIIREGSVFQLEAMRDVEDKADRLIAALENTWTRGPDAGKRDKLPMDVNTKKLIELGLVHADLPQSQAGIRHLMLGLLLLPESPLAGAFESISIDPNILAKRMLDDS